MGTYWYASRTVNSPILGLGSEPGSSGQASKASKELCFNVFQWFWIEESLVLGLIPKVKSYINKSFDKLFTWQVLQLKTEFCFIFYGLLHDFGAI